MKSSSLEDEDDLTKVALAGLDPDYPTSAPRLTPYSDSFDNAVVVVHYLFPSVSLSLALAPIYQLCSWNLKKSTN